jgi:hypothetical protein|tara:strand:+ start:714 stop:860 length:147 start_codon:yes stop_codon:yes gene_type:complete
MSDYKMEYLPNEDEQRQQMTLEEEEQYKKEYEEWLDKIEKEKEDEPKR